MREKKPIVIANWKMALTNSGVAQLLIDALDQLQDDPKSVRTVICPSFPALAIVHEMLERTNIALGAQDVFWRTRASFTGEVSVEQLIDVGCTYVIVGHSERREHLGETDTIVQQKFVKALESRLIPILCVGETRDERLGGMRETVVMRQLQHAFQGVELDAKVIVAYEPVWVIGTGQAVEPSDARGMGIVIRDALINMLGEKTFEENVEIVYGGSVTHENVGDFIDGDVLRGVLVGGASQEAKSLADLIHASTEIVYTGDKK